MECYLVRQVHPLCPLARTDLLPRWRLLHKIQQHTQHRSTHNTAGSTLELTSCVPFSVKRPRSQANYYDACLRWRCTSLLVKAGTTQVRLQANPGIVHLSPLDAASLNNWRQIMRCVSLSGERLKQDSLKGHPGSPPDLQLANSPWYHVCMSACPQAFVGRGQLAAFCCGRGPAWPQQSKRTARTPLPFARKTILLVCLGCRSEVPSRVFEWLGESCPWEWTFRPPIYSWDCV
jgi:hypothetical protein